MTTVALSHSRDVQCRWPRVELKDVAASIQYGYTASATQRDGVRFLRISDIQNNRVDWSTVPSCHIEAGDVAKYRLMPGDIMFARTGATTGKSFLIRDCPPAVFASYLICVRPSHLVLPTFLAAFFQSDDYWRQIEHGKRGIGQPNVNATTLGSISVPLPPIEEQRRIVAEIEKQFTRLDAADSSVKRVQANAGRYREAVAAAACEGRLLLRGSNEPNGPKEIHASWTWARLEELCSVFVDSAHRTPKYGPGGALALGPRDLVYGQLNLSRSRSVSDEEFAIQTRRRIPRQGDIVYSRELSLGWAAAIPAGVRVCLSQGMCLFRPGDKLLGEYLLIVLNGPVGRGQALAAATGSAHPHINLRSIKEYKIPVPSLDEQRAIVREVQRQFSVLEQLASISEATIQRAANLRQAILQRAFSGQL